MAGRVTSPVVVGREVELQALTEALGRAEGGEPVHLLIAGEAGVGKTRLVAEATGRARERGFRVLRGDCINLGSSSLPYGPFVEALRGLLAELGAEDLAACAGPGAADLAQLVPGLRAGRAAPPTQSEWVQARLFEALLGLLTRLAERSPVLLAVDDLHWADDASRETLAFLVRVVRDLPLVTLGTYRSDELHRRHPLLPWIAELERTGRVERLDLGRLDRESVTALVGSIVGERPPATLVDRVFERSDGNPFFVEELVAADRRGGAGSRLPPTLRDVLLAHVAAAPEVAQPVLGIAAVAGRRVEHDLLARVAAMPAGELHEGLRAAVAANLLVVETDGPIDRYAFRHALVQEAVYDERLPSERRILHRAFAEALAAEPVPPSGASAAGYWAEVAHHWAAAREDRRAYEASLRAADEAMTSFAFRAALDAYERALELWEGVPDAAELAGCDRIELLRRAGRAGYLAGRFRHATAHRREAIGLADAAGDRLRGGILREELGRSLYTNGERAAALEAYRAAVETIPADPPTAERARAVAAYGQMLMLLSRFEESRAVCEEAVAIARATGARAHEGHALATLGLDLASLGHGSRGVEATAEGLRIARDLPDVSDIGRAYVQLAETLDEAGRTPEAVDVTFEGIRVAEQLGVGHSYGLYIRAGGATFSWIVGRWDEGRRFLREAVAREPAAAGAELYRLTYGLPLVVGEGSPEADAAVARALDLIAGDPGDQHTGPVHGAAAEHALWRGEPRRALELAETGIELLAATDDRHELARLCRIGAWAAGDLADGARVRRDAALLDEARERLAAIREHIGRVLAAMPAERARLTVELDAAAVEAETGRLEDRSDADRWCELASAWSADDRPYFAAYARWREAEAALAAGDRRAATEALREAHAVARRLGAAPLRAALEDIARRARLGLADGSDGAGADADPFGLTPREREVLSLLAAGHTNRRIADALFITESTAGVHVSNILGKLGVATRGEAAALAFRLRLVEPGLEPGSDEPA